MRHPCEKCGLAADERRNRNRIQATLVKTVIALPLLDKLAADTGNGQYDIIIDSHLDFPKGRSAARLWILDALAYLLGSPLEDARLKRSKNEDENQYVFARLPTATIRSLVAADASREALPGEESRGHTLTGALPKKPIPPTWDVEKLGVPRAIYQVWEDFQIVPLIFSRISTVKADAARAPLGPVAMTLLGRLSTRASNLIIFTLPAT